MKNLFTLFVSLLATVTFAQNSLVPSVHTYYRDPNSPVPSSLLHHGQQGVFRTTASACDTGDYLDQSTYNEVVAGQLNLNFNGSWNSQSPSILAQEISPFVDTFHAGDYTYAEGFWDSIAFGDLSTGTTAYYPLANSTIYLDSLGMFIGIGGDTLPLDGKMTNDSIVFSIYSVAGTNPTLVNQVVFSGYAGLDPFFKGPGYLGYVQVPIHQQFSQGQAFAIRMDYLPKDTSSHLLLSYCYADSCGTVIYENQQISSPAYPSPFVGSALWGHTYFNDAGTGATVQDENSGFAYTGYGWPTDCSFVYTQNWEFLPQINVCVEYGANIQATPTNACPGGTVNLNASAFGTTSSNINYSWVTSAGTLTDQSSSSTSLVMPDSGNATVIVTVNDGQNGNVYDTVVITNNAIKVRIINANPISIACGGAPETVASQISGITAGKSYSWSNGTSGANAATISVSTPGTYTVTVSNSSGCTATASVSVEYEGGISNNVNFTPPNPPLCAGKSVTFTNTSSDLNSGWTSNWSMGDLGTVNTQNATYTYSNQGIYTVSLQMDSGGCTFTSNPQTITVLASSNQQCLAGIEDITFDNAISLIPNPSNGNVNVVIYGVEKNLSITVYNIIGSEVSSYTATDVPTAFSKNFDFSDLASGTYLMKIQSADKTAIKKLVISK